MQGASSGFVGEPVSFSAAGSTAGSSAIQSFAWDFGDGTSAAASAGTEATHLYNHGGTFQVTVIVTDAAGLSSSATTQVVISARLETTVWSLTTKQASIVAPVPGTAITLQFLNGQIAGFAGCNSYTGSYSAVDNGDGTFAVTPANLNATRMTCPQEVMQTETAFLTALAQVTTAQLQGETLVLSTPSGNLVFDEMYTPR